MPSSQKTILIVLSILISSGVTPIIIRITQDQGMPSLVIAFIRLWLVSLGLMPIVWTRYRQQLLSLSKKQILFGIFAGFWLAINLLMFFDTSLIRNHELSYRVNFIAPEFNPNGVFK